MLSVLVIRLIFFFFNDTATTEIYPLSLHDALPISADVFGEHEVEGLLQRPPLGGERRDVLEYGLSRFARGQHLTAAGSWLGPTRGSRGSRATPCRRIGTPGTRRGSADCP